MRQVDAWQARSLLNRSPASRYGFDVTVNPYRGCAHGCEYCYARDTHSYLGLNIGNDFTQRLFVKSRSAIDIASELRRLPLSQVIALGTATDPYQSLEGRHQVSRKLLGEVYKSGHALTITTKSPLILRDLDLLAALAKRGQLRVNVSLISLNRSLLQALEPGAPAPSVRLQTIRELSGHGVPTVLFAAPILPYLTDASEPLAALFEAARNAGAVGVMTSRLHLTPTIKAHFFAWLNSYQPSLHTRYQRLYPGDAQYPLATYSRELWSRVDVLKLRANLQQDFPEPRPWQPVIQPEFDI